MKTINRVILVFAILLSIFSGRSFAQDISAQQTEFGGAYPIKTNDAVHPCISPEQYHMIEQRMADNIKQLKLNTERKTAVSTTLSWPLETANGLNDCSYYVIFNYVDQDPTTPGIKDYNCGTVTYDGHRGTDIATEPYPFYKMDNSEVNVIAAAPGTIIEKSDGYFDRNCAMNTDTANYIIIQHTDGSVALYWHMKKFSLTAKTVGQTVVAGEFLGVVGSSGDATGPHLHLEVWSTTSSGTLNDPYAGTCNTLNAATWWVTQKPYTEPAVIKTQVNSVKAILPGCDTTETPNEDSCFAGGASGIFYIFFRNETAGTTATLSILNPGGSTFTSWVHNSSTNYLASYWYWYKTLPTTAGTYTFQTVYNGITCSKTFKINCGTLGVPIMAYLPEVEVSPNPASNMLNIAAEGIDNGPCKLIIRNILGQAVAEGNTVIENNDLQKNISISDLPDGMYFVVMETEKNKIVKKFIKQN